MLDQQSILQKYQQGISGGSQNWLKAMQSLSVNPAQLAASPQGMQNWLSGVQASVSKRQSSLSRVSLADIQGAAASYGAQNYANSATKASAKWGKKLPGMMSLWQAQRAAANAVPRQPGTSNIARVQAVIALAMAAKGKL